MFFFKKNFFSLTVSQLRTNKIFFHFSCRANEIFCIFAVSFDVIGQLSSKAWLNFLSY